MDGRHKLRVLRGFAVVAVDLRSLAALRMVLALTVLADLAMRAPNLRVHYSDEGIVPRAVLLERLDPWLWSVALGNGTPFFQGLLFVVAAAAAVGLLIGYRTRLMTLVAWALMLSIHWRNPFVGYSADGLLRLLLFWSLFVPLGAVWSLDRQREAIPRPASGRVLSLGTAGLLLQIALMYWVTALLKSGREWRVDGSALAYALSIQELATPLGTALLHHPELLKAMTFLTLGIEIVAPLLLFAPVWRIPLRMAGIAAIVGLQAGIWLTLRLGIFPWLAAACMVVFLPSWFWDRLTALTSLPLLSRWSSHSGGFAVGLRPAGAASSSPAGGQGEAGIQRAVTSLDAAAAQERWSPSLLNLAAGFCLVFVLAWNLASVSAVALTEETRAVGSLLGLAQPWTMFAPYPFDSTTWYAIPGVLRDGRRIDVLPFLFSSDPRHVTPASQEKPRDMSAAFAGDERWRKYFESLHDADNAHLLEPLGDYLCREWNAAHTRTSAELGSLQIVYHWERNLPDQQRAPAQQAVQWEQRCLAETP